MLERLEASMSPCLATVVNRAQGNIDVGVRTQLEVSLRSTARIFQGQRFPSSEPHVTVQGRTTHLCLSSSTPPACTKTPPPSLYGSPRLVDIR